MQVKAFLSHSSQNKDVVRNVADFLGRQFCIFDERSFDTGDEFKEAIRNGLDESTIFVLFVSRASLSSLWVDFEIEEAWSRILKKQLTKSLVYILDDTIAISELPKWLTRAKATFANAPKAIARQIRDHLLEILRQQQQPVFIGRSSDTEEFQRVLLPIDGSPPPRIIIISGLPSIGRRTFIRRVIPNSLNLRQAIEISIQEGDELTDIALKIADLIEPVSTQTDFLRIVDSIRSSDNDALIRRIIGDVQLCISNGELPLFVDQGGLLDSNGRWSASVQRILASIPTTGDYYLFIVTPRRPSQDEALKIPVVQLKELKNEECKQLIAALAARVGCELKAGEIAEIADYTGGYPPSCNFAVQQIKDEGISKVLAQKQLLVEFRTRYFIKHLTTANLTPDELPLLKTLAEYSPLPLAAIGNALGLDTAEVSKRMSRLLDYSLVIVTDRHLYSAAEPIRDAVTKMCGIMTRLENSALANALKSHLEDNNLTESRLELSRVLFRVANNARDEQLANSVVHLANDVIQLLEQNYHSRNYLEAIKYGRTATDLRPHSLEAWGLLIRAYIQEHSWDDAEAAITRIQSFAPNRDIYFLKGFLSRKKGDFQNGLAYFLKAESSGRRGQALKRELANCYLILGNYDEASRYITDLLRTQADSRFVLDLAVRIASKRRDESSARQYLALLEKVDSEGFYYHRLSCVDQDFGQFNSALIAAREAIQREGRPPFEMIAHAVACELRLGNTNEAEALLARLDKQFSHKQFAFRTNLHAHLALTRGEYDRALQMLGKNATESDPFFKSLKASALKGILKSSILDSRQRAEYQTELDILQAGSVDLSQLWLDYIALEQGDT